MSVSGTPNPPHPVLFRITVDVSVIAIAVTSIVIAIRTHSISAPLVALGWHLVVYGMILRYAWICRESKLATGYVAVMACVTAALGAYVLLAVLWPERLFLRIR